MKTVKAVLHVRQFETAESGSKTSDRLRLMAGVTQGHTLANPPRGWVGAPPWSVR